jgi:protein-tyrosine phosphatase
VKETVVRVLFVCMGNICRSPIAEGVFRRAVADSGLEAQIAADSAGTHDYHVGEPPDRRARAAARARGVDLEGLRARAIEAADFRRFDYILVMEEWQRRELLELCPATARAQPRLLLEFAPRIETREVPDPYYGGSDGFEFVLDLAEAAARGLLDDIRRVHLSRAP